jgi:hypothetical protein
MEYINFNPKLISRKYEKINNYKFNFLDIIKENLPIECIYYYINHLIIYKLNNVWNCVVIQWIEVNNKMQKRNKKKYLNSDYCNQKYKHNHNIISYEKLNNLLNYFIDNDKFKALFVAICIQNTFHI